MWDIWLAAVATSWGIYNGFGFEWGCHEATNGMETCGIHLR